MERKRDELNPALAGFTLAELVRELSARTNGWSPDAKGGAEGVLIASLRAWHADPSPMVENHPVAAFAEAYGAAIAKYHAGALKADGPEMAKLEAAAAQVVPRVE